MLKGIAIGGFLIALGLLILFAVVCGISACMLSSRISREEEREEVERGG